MAMRQGPMEPGERDRRVTIQRLTDGISTPGYPVETWSTLAEVWMAKMDRSGDESFRSDQVSGRFETRWEMPYRADMDPDLVDVPKARRLVFRGRTHDIVSASMIGMRAGVELLTVAASKR